MADIEKKWYVVKAVSGKEKKVKDYIELEISRAKLQDYVSQVLIPTEKVYQIKDGKKIIKEKSFFPGYIMVEAALVGEVPHIIKSVTNVIGFLGAVKGGDPLPLRAKEVARMLGAVDDLAETIEDMSIPFVVGEHVKVTDGPFNNFTGVVEEVDADKKKLKVMVKIFGRKTPVELSYMQVEKQA